MDHIPRTPNISKTRAIHKKRQQTMAWNDKSKTIPIVMVVGQWKGALCRQRIIWHPFWDKFLSTLVVKLQHNSKWSILGKTFIHILFLVMKYNMKQEYVLWTITKNIIVTTEDAHEFHEIRHSVTSYFMNKDSKWCCDT